MDTPPQQRRNGLAAVRLVRTGPFCHAFKEGAPEEGCDKFGRIRVFLRTGLLDNYCTRCWENIRPGLALLVVRTTRVEGFAPPKQLGN